MIAELIFTPMLAISSGVCSNKIEECLRKFLKLEWKHKTILKLFQMDLNFYAFGCFKVDFGILKIVSQVLCKMDNVKFYFNFLDLHWHRFLFDGFAAVQIFRLKFDFSCHFHFSLPNFIIFQTFCEFFLNFFYGTSSRSVEALISS